MSHPETKVRSKIRQSNSVVIGKSKPKWLEKRARIFSVSVGGKTLVAAEEEESNKGGKAVAAQHRDSFGVY